MLWVPCMAHVQETFFERLNNKPIVIKLNALVDRVFQVIGLLAKIPAGGKTPSEPHFQVAVVSFCCRHVGACSIVLLSEASYLAISTSCRCVPFSATLHTISKQPCPVANGIAFTYT